MFQRYLTLQQPHESTSTTLIYISYYIVVQLVFSLPLSAT